MEALKNEEDFAQTTAGERVSSGEEQVQRASRCKRVVTSRG